MHTIVKVRSFRNGPVLDWPTVFFIIGAGLTVAVVVWALLRVFGWFEY